MKRIFHLACIVVGVCVVGACTKSVERAQRDVQRAHNQAVQDVHRKQTDLKETQQEASERIAQKERRVEDAARSGNENIIKQERELQDAQRAEAKREINSTDAATPRINDRSASEANRPAAHVDVNVNRGPGGVTVDVNRNP